MRERHNHTTTLALVLAILGLASVAEAKPIMYSASLILHAFANDATGALQALPLGAECNPANGGSTCLMETLHEGAPLTGTGMANLQGEMPFDFSLWTGRLERTTDGSFPPYPGISYTLTNANLGNGLGVFSAKNGHGSFSFVPTLGAGLTRVVAVAGKNQFGGVMELIGNFGTEIAGSTSGGGEWYGSFPTWGVRVAGAKYGRTQMISGSIMFTSPTLTYASVAVVTGFPWTTGQVYVVAAGGSGFPTALVRSGYDNRTAQGGGIIQMVAPRLTHWSGGAHWGDIAILNVKFVPEPKGWLMLVAGLGFLGAMHRARTSSPTPPTSASAAPPRACCSGSSASAKSSA